MISISASEMIWEYSRDTSAFLSVSSVNEINKGVYFVYSHIKIIARKH